MSIHEWTKFETQVLYSLFVKGLHNIPFDPTKSRSRQQYMDIATALNRAINKDDISNDIPLQDVALMVKRIIKENQGAMAFLERNKSGHLTRVMLRRFQRKLNFTGTKEEWKNGMRDRQMGRVKPFFDPSSVEKVERVERDIWGAVVPKAKDVTETPIASIEAWGAGVPDTGVVVNAWGDGDNVPGDTTGGAWGEAAVSTVSGAATGVADAWGGGDSGNAAVTTLGDTATGTGDAWGGGGEDSAATVNTGAVAGAGVADAWGGVDGDSAATVNIGAGADQSADEDDPFRPFGAASTINTAPTSTQANSTVADSVWGGGTPALIPIAGADGYGGSSYAATSYAEPAQISVASSDGWGGGGGSGGSVASFVEPPAVQTTNTVSDSWGGGSSYAESAAPNYAESAAPSYAESAAPSVASSGDWGGGSTEPAFQMSTLSSWDDAPPTVPVPVYNPETAGWPSAGVTNVVQATNSNSPASNTMARPNKYMRAPEHLAETMSQSGLNPERLAMLERRSASPSETPAEEQNNQDDFTVSARFSPSFKPNPVGGANADPLPYNRFVGQRPGVMDTVLPSPRDTILPAPTLTRNSSFEDPMHGVEQPWLSDNNKENIDPELRREGESAEGWRAGWGVDAEELPDAPASADDWSAGGGWGGA